MKEYLVFTGILAVLAGATAFYCDTQMRMEVNEKLPPDKRFHWWRQTGSTMMQYRRKYRELYPTSRVPLIWRCSVAIAVVGFVLWCALWR